MKPERGEKATKKVTAEENARTKVKVQRFYIERYANTCEVRDSPRHLSNFAVRTVPCQAQGEREGQAQTKRSYFASSPRRVCLCST